MSNLTFSIEVFPPKDSTAVGEIYNTLGQFAALSPDFISVTYGAGGTARGQSAEISGYISGNLAIPGVAHLTCVGATKDNIRDTLADFKARGVKRILALRGDLPEGEASLGDFRHADDLIAFINDFGGFEVYAACYPEGHSESKNFAADVEVAKRKYDMGVTRFVSQLFYDNEDFYRMRDAFAAAGVNAPISAGIMPITNAKQILRIVSLSGSKLPAAITKAVARFEHNAQAFYQAGINYAVSQITDLLSNGAEGIHLYSMNRPKTAEDIYRNIGSLLEGAKE